VSKAAGSAVEGDVLHECGQGGQGSDARLFKRFKQYQEVCANGVRMLT
jgi:hypothetical protein